ncbi:ParA family protein [Bradyrhizobium guangzhouense]|uniref:ParA family protein n=1 Tax=Bradyrhizobium guangzhouense TaxID=1325095 RepID=UPI0010099AE2|nr:ParA family protein [Bradyrhizobium guangzhouense]RXH14738.1 ParA family protein [Bradyrhizobium guangzhouense]
MAGRSSAKRISIFNHKGGVGKTTLTFHIAAQLSELGKRVLLVDSDPQCNVTAYVIDNEVLDDLLDHSDDDNGQTVWSAVKPLLDVSGPPIEIEPIDLFSKLLLAPGDIRLSEFEEELNDYWRQCFQRKRSGFAGTMALSSIVNRLCREHRIDFVFYDSGPNIGPLNRAILLDCDYFIIPVAYDLFSIRALKTLGRTLHRWITDWQTVKDLAPEGTYLLPGRPRFLGYIPQNFTVYRGAPASQHSRYIGQLERSIQSDIVSVLREVGASPSKFSNKLGEIKDLGTLVAASQREGVPVYSVSVGTQAQRTAAKNSFRAIAQRIIRLTS